MISKTKLDTKQKELDELKWRESQIAKQDLSGKMEYCRHCAICYQQFRQCQLDQTSRELNHVCAKAFFNMEGEN